jgi:hypothetical protein
MRGRSNDGRTTSRGAGRRTQAVAGAAVVGCGLARDIGVAARGTEVVRVTVRLSHGAGVRAAAERPGTADAARSRRAFAAGAARRSADAARRGLVRSPGAARRSTGAAASPIARRNARRAGAPRRLADGQPEHDQQSQREPVWRCRSGSAHASRTCTTHARINAAESRSGRGAHSPGALTRTEMSHVDASQLSSAST